VYLSFHSAPDHCGTQVQIDAMLDALEQFVPDDAYCVLNVTLQDLYQVDCCGMNPTWDAVVTSHDAVHCGVCRLRRRMAMRSSSGTQGGEQPCFRSFGAPCPMCTSVGIELPSPLPPLRVPRACVPDTNPTSPQNYPTQPPHLEPRWPRKTSAFSWRHAAKR